MGVPASDADDLAAKIKAEEMHKLAHPEAPKTAIEDVTNVKSVAHLVKLDRLKEVFAWLKSWCNSNDGFAEELTVENVIMKSHTMVPSPNSASAGDLIAILQRNGILHGFDRVVPANSGMKNIILTADDIEMIKKLEGLPERLTLPKGFEWER